MTILTVTLNAAIDKRYELPAVRVGAVQRVDRVTATAGGKGLNVSRGALLCGQRVVATGFIGGFAGEFVTSQAAAMGVRDEFVRVAGETRTCVNIIDADGRSTEFLEPGVTVGADEIAALGVRFEGLLAEVDVVTLSGSAPIGCPEDVYASLVAAARAAGRPVILDTNGSLLTAALRAGPSVVKPNREELAAILGRPLDDLAAVASAARELRRLGAEWVVVSLGAEGAMAVGRDRCVRVMAPKVQALNPVGCGDVLVGALAAGLARGLAGGLGGLAGELAGVAGGLAGGRDGLAGGPVGGLDVPAALPGAVRAATAAAVHPGTGSFDPAVAAGLTIRSEEL